MKNFNTYGISKNNFKKIMPLIKDDNVHINIILTIFISIISLFLLINTFQKNASIDFQMLLFTILLAITSIIIRLVTRFQSNYIIDTACDIILTLNLLVNSNFSNPTMPLMQIIIILTFSQLIRLKKFYLSIFNEFIILIYVYYIIVVYRKLEIPNHFLLKTLIFTLVILILNYFYMKYRTRCYIKKYNFKINTEKKLILAKNISNKFVAFAKEINTILVEYDLNSKEIICDHKKDNDLKFFVADGNDIYEKISNMTSLNENNKNLLRKLFNDADKLIESEIILEFFDNKSFHFLIKTVFLDEIDDSCLVLIKDVSLEHKAKQEYEELINYQNYQLKDSFVSIVYNISKNQLISSNGQGDYHNYFISKTYQEMTQSLIKIMPLKKDKLNFLKLFSKDKLIKDFENGIKNSSLQFTINIDGDYKLIKLNNIVTVNPNTSDLVSISTMNDVTKNHQMEALLEGTIKYGYDFTAIINLEFNNCILYNPSGEIEKLSNDNFFKILASNSIKDLIKDIANLNDIKLVLKRNNYYQYIYDTVDHKSKKIIFFRISDTEIGLLQNDITSYSESDKRTLEELQNALNGAKSANKAKSVFLSRMSHDIRTPLNAIIGLTDISMNEIENQIADNHYGNFKLIKENSNHLLELINDVLEMSSIESDKLTLNEEVFDLEKNLTSIVDRLKSITFEKNIKILLKNNFSNYLVKTDKLKLNRIIENLLNNAIKYSPNSSIIEIQCRELIHYNKLVEFEFSVKDHGLGIPKNRLNEIFDPFVTGEKENFKGTGLGLTIVKQLIDTLGGSIKVESELNKGSTFTFKLPLTITQSKETIPHYSSNYNFKNLTILVVEDNKINSKILTKLLNSKGIKVINAYNGQEGFDIYQQMQDKIDLILMDISMPIMDGLESTKLIRKINSTIPIVALSANAFIEDRRNSIKVGMNAHISKPINQEILFEKIAQFTQNK